MKKAFIVIAVCLSALLIGSTLLIETKQTPERPRVKSTFSPKSIKQEKAGRDEYFFNMLKDPATNEIPRNIRSKELSFSKELDKNTATSLRGESIGFDWKEAGPNDVGGRTRALGIDVRNSDVIIAGGVSGGVYRSTDKGANWTLVNNPDEYNGITSIAQDTRDGHQDTWYYTTGEFAGNSASAQGWSAGYYGNGMYKSTDNGVSWSLVTNTDSNLAKWDSDFDYVSKVKVNPTTGSVYICSNGIGLIRLGEGADINNKKLVLGKVNAYYWCDIDIHYDGTIIAFLSQSKPSNGVQDKAPGVYISSDDGENFTMITKPSTFPKIFDRGLVRISPSNKNIAYLFMVDGETPYFFKIDLAAKTMEDRSANIGEEYQGFISWNKVKLGAQGDYNMTLAIHPTDENFVIVGNTCLFRSKDAFISKPNVFYTWIGGYGNQATGNFQHPNHHPDCHITVFDPNNPNQVWSGHDGGLSFCSDITKETNSSSYVQWINKNKGYNITQFYNVAINHTAEGDEFVGGAQDNGSPYFEFNGATATPSEDMSSGDGSYCAITPNYIYASSQYGKITRQTKGSNAWTRVNPSGLDDYDKLFIHPYCIDQNNNNIMYYPVKGNLWVNSNLSAIPSSQQNGSLVNWKQFTVAYSGKITTLASSVEPANIVYVATYSNYGNPEVYKIENPLEETRVITNVSIPTAASGSYSHDIAINPEDANEFIVVLSNYNIKGLYHTIDGGKNYTCIEGNLEGTSDITGPSLRSAAINVKSGNKKYFVGTSTGLYSTSALDGDNTIWEKVEKELIGSVIVNDIDLNHVNGNMAIGTHGRGIFSAKNANSFIYAENPISDIVMNGGTEEIIVKKSLSDVFKGNGIFEYSVTEDSDNSLLSAEIVGNEIVLKIKPNTSGKAIIKVKCSTKEAYTFDSFSIEVVIPTVKNLKFITDFRLSVNEKSSFEIDLLEYFDGGINYEVSNNSNPELITTSFVDSKLIMKIKPDLAGESVINIKCSNHFNSYVLQSFKIIVSAVTAIENTLSNKFKVYPNPSNGVSFVEVDESKLSGSLLKVVNSNGKVVFETILQGSKTSVDISNQPQGIYFFKISKGNDKGVKKVIRK